MRSPAPAGGEWVLLAELRGRRPVLLLGVAGAEGVSWSTTDVDVASCWLTRAAAAGVRRDEVARRGRLLIRVVRRADAVVLLRWAKVGVLVDLRATG